MSNCMSCGRSIKLKKGEELCPSCGKNPFQCWNCQVEITGKEEECPICHFYVCSGCGSCGANCRLSELVEEVKGKSVRDIIKYCYAQKDDKERRICQRNIPISYAHGKLRDFYLKTEGLRTKDKNDMEAFESKVENINKYPIGFTWTIKDIKDAGTHGHESREASNLAVCIGIVKCERNTFEELLPEKYKAGEKKGQNKIRKVTYWRYTRIEENPCEYLDLRKAISFRCELCKIEAEGKICGKCGKPTTERASHCNICNLERGMFKKKGEVVDGSKLDRRREEKNS